MLLCRESSSLLQFTVVPDSHAKDSLFQPINAYSHYFFVVLDYKGKNSSFLNLIMALFLHKLDLTFTSSSKIICKLQFNMQLYCFRSDLVFNCYVIRYETDLEACLKIPTIIVHGAIGLNPFFPSHSSLLLLSFEFSLKWWQSCPPHPVPPHPQTSLHL